MGILPREGPLEQNWKNSQANKERLLEEFMLQSIRERMEEINIYQVLTFMFKI